MKRKTLRLTSKAVANQRVPGYYPDGLGVYLQVSPSASKSWIFRYTLNGRERQMGLGPVHTVTLAEAREAAADCRKLLLHKIDPLEERKRREAERAKDTAATIVFADAATAYIKANRAGWKNAKHADQWTSTIETYCGPIIGKLSVRDITTEHVERVLDPIWTTKPETARRVRGRIEKILDWARVKGYREKDKDNPARLRGHLDKIFPKLNKAARVVHHAALPYAQIDAFMELVRAEDGVAARALEFTILTACRTGEVIGAKWAEFDLEAKVWTVPAERMKAGREHRVPLADRAVAIVKTLQKTADGEFAFPGGKRGKPLSNMAMLQLLKRMERNDITVHGFRSTFRDWAAECTAYPREVCEMALAHTVSSAVEAAYRRGDLFEKRRRLMAEWARYCATTTKAEGKVIPMERRAKRA